MNTFSIIAGCLIMLIGVGVLFLICNALAHGAVNYIDFLNKKRED